MIINIRQYDNLKFRVFKNKQNPFIFKGVIYFEQKDMEQLKLKTDTFTYENVDEDKVLRMMEKFLSEIVKQKVKLEKTFEEKNLHYVLNDDEKSDKCFHTREYTKFEKFKKNLFNKPDRWNWLKEFKPVEDKDEKLSM